MFPETSGGEFIQVQSLSRKSNVQNPGKLVDTFGHWTLEVSSKFSVVSGKL